MNTAYQLKRAIERAEGSGLGNTELVKQVKKIAGNQQSTTAATRQRLAQLLTATIAERVGVGTRFTAWNAKGEWTVVRIISDSKKKPIKAADENGRTGFFHYDQVTLR